MITANDIIYFVLTDRFYDGDKNNNYNVDLLKPKSFHGGDFSGLKEKIDYFNKLGITTLWITPVYLNIFDNGSNHDEAGYHGYWAIDFERVDNHLYSPIQGREEGSKEYLKELVDFFHNEGFKVVLDMVVNHTGYHTESYQNNNPQVFNKGDYNTGEGPVNGDLCGLPDLDHDQIKVVDYFIQNIMRWIEETGIDGIRMDTVKHVEGKFWYHYKSIIKMRYPNVTLIGEVLDFDIESVSKYQKYHDFEYLFDFPLCQAIKDCFIYDCSMNRIARPRLHESEYKGILDRDTSYSNANRLITLLDNHDLNKRIASEISDHVGAWDHNLRNEILKLCLTFIFTTRGIPQIYYGTEVSLEGYKDPDNRKDMPWDWFDNNYTPIDENRKIIFNHTQKVINLRKNHPALCYGYLITIYSDFFVYAYLREFQGNLVIVVINNGREGMDHHLSIDLKINSNIPPRILNLLVDGTILTSKEDGVSDIVIQDKVLRVRLPRKTAGIFVL